LGSPTATVKPTPSKVLDGVFFHVALDHHCCFGVYVLLVFIRFSTGGSLVTEKGDDEVEEIDEADMVYDSLSGGWI
jgi:hypothetical protein